MSGCNSCGVDEKPKMRVNVPVAIGAVTAFGFKVVFAVDPGNSLSVFIDDGNNIVAQGGGYPYELENSMHTALLGLRRHLDNQWRCANAIDSVFLSFTSSSGAPPVPPGLKRAKVG